MDRRNRPHKKRTATRDIGVSRGTRVGGRRSIEEDRVWLHLLIPMRLANRFIPRLGEEI